MCVRVCIYIYKCTYVCILRVRANFVNGVSLFDVDAIVESVDMKDVSKGLQERLDADLPLMGSTVGIPCIHASTSSSTPARDERRASSSR